MTLLLTLLSACGGGSSSTTPVAIKTAPVGDIGIFDPSISKDPNSGRLWMSYSSVDISAYYEPTTYWAVSIRLAYSDDNGVTWWDAGVVISDKVETLVGPFDDIAAGSKGIWQSETSSLIYDPSAPISERWKLIWSHYLNANFDVWQSESSRFDHGWIAMKMAATPLDLATATTVKLFGSIGLKTDSINTGAPVFSPVGGVPEIQLNTDLSLSHGGANLSDLTRCLFVEPSLHASNTFVYLTMTCFDIPDPPPPANPIEQHIVHFRCSSPCSMSSASSWEYLGRLLTPNDAVEATGYQFYQAPALVEKNGTDYLLVTPVNIASQTPYSGCRVYEFDDINSNQLRRSSGQLVEIARIDGGSDTHNGACAAWSGLDGGILLSQFDPTKAPKTFNIYSSLVSLP